MSNAFREVEIDGIRLEAEIYRVRDYRGLKITAGRLHPASIHCSRWDRERLAVFASVGNHDITDSEIFDMLINEWKKRNLPKYRLIRWLRRFRCIDDWVVRRHVKGMIDNAAPAERPEREIK